MMPRTFTHTFRQIDRQSSRRYVWS